MKRETGARALRAIMDEIMVDLLYDLPERDNEGVTYVLDAESVEGGASLERMERRSRSSA
jgi:ATP-dependent Clp protease ATP-binding subunit ClpX